MRFTEPQMRPPQEANSLLLRATQGCSYNKCRFCYVSRNYPYQAVTNEELEAEIARFKRHFPKDTPIYLTGSNPLALPVRILEGWIGILRKHFPYFCRLSMQTRIGDLRHKSDADLARLKELGLGHLYIGTESGNDRVLALMDKGQTSDEIVTQLLRLDKCGITYTNFYVLGLGGKGAGLESGLATAAMFNKVHPQRITTTGLTIFPDTPLADMVKNGEFTEASEREKIEELQAFLQALDIDVFYDGVHYLNPLNYRFANRDAQAKQAALDDIQSVLATYSDAELELMVSRHTMKSL